MYLSKVTLAGSSSLAQVLLELDKNDTYASHQLLWKELFHQDKQRQFIYRHEMDKRKMPMFYVLSQHVPESSQVLAVQTKAFQPQLHENQRLAYRMRINPTVCQTDENGRSRRHDVMMHAKAQYKRHNQRGKESEELRQKMHEAAQQWMCNETRLERWGVELATIPEIETYTQHKSYKKKRNEKAHQIRFSSVDIQGILTVKDPQRFLKQYEQGFGRAKSMGCGLMLIRNMSCHSSP